MFNLKNSLANDLLTRSFALLDPYQNLAQKISFNGGAVCLQNKTLPIKGQVHLFGLGKAAAYDVSALRKLLIEHGLKTAIGSCTAYTKKGHSVIGDFLLQLEGSHPEMSLENLENTKRFIEGLEKIPKEDTLFFLLSGGGSALLELPIEGIGVQELIDKNHSLLRSGESIEEINKKRKTLSQVKDGGLCHFVHTNNFYQLITSDIPGNSLADVSSGPFVGSKGSFLNQTFLIQSAEQVIEEICNEFSSFKNGGILNRDFDTGVNWCLQNLPVSGQGIVSGGELPVRVLDSASGKGGRNTHFVLRMAQIIFQKEENRDLKILSFASDGSDGDTDGAGAYIDYELFRTLDCQDYLEKFDSYHYFKTLGTLIKTGPTGSNVMDLRFIWRE